MKEIKKAGKKGSLLSYLGDKIRKKWLDCKQNFIFFCTDAKVKRKMASRKKLYHVTRDRCPKTV